MSLRTLAQLDNQKIIEDTAGFGWPITVTDPSGTQVAMVGNSYDIGVQVDPDTGALVAGRTATVTLNLKSLNANGLDTPRNITDRASKPWLVTFNDLHGTEQTFKVISFFPDNTLGFVTCQLGNYEQ